MSRMACARSPVKDILRATACARTARSAGRAASADSRGRAQAAAAHLGAIVLRQPCQDVVLIDDGPTVPGRARPGDQPYLQLPLLPRTLRGSAWLSAPGRRPGPRHSCQAQATRDEAVLAWRGACLGQHHRCVRAPHTGVHQCWPHRARHQRLLSDSTVTHLGVPRQGQVGPRAALLRQQHPPLEGGHLRLVLPLPRLVGGGDVRAQAGVHPHGQLPEAAAHLRMLLTDLQTGPGPKVQPRRTCVTPPVILPMRLYPWAGGCKSALPAGTCQQKAYRRGAPPAARPACRG